ncbi:O-succinylbenzoic acid--CoA ligase [Oikeobacillus pervagus]|uniref:2-succinylbenzoate--CoA ligase n=1 Tax=Oikeobacillus pervagus TaxID=1325931 RepID=A0AAJ1T4E8_9BACI|nr:o-succinylbenzoate--CoA ligase [Oikeobacillus pervagus]MDQ0216562.1 O-succinylbenzoic acid--CoA ligase [Oikeobacillus pervagus]
MATTLPNWLKQRAFLTPDREAIRFEKESYTFGQLYEAAKKYAHYFASIGLQKGDFAAVLLKNKPTTIFIIHAFQQLGVPTVLLNHRLTAQELNFQLKDSHAKLLVCDDEFDSLSLQLPNDCQKVLLHQIDLTSTSSFRSEYDLDEICTIMYTSGTTGNPKGVKQSYGNHWWSAMGSSLNLGLYEQDIWLCAVPLFHISGYSILMRSVIYGMTVHLFEHFNEQKINELLVKGEGTIISVVSTMLQRLLHDQTEPYHSRFRCMLLGGGPAPKPLLEQCRDKGIPVFQTYGMTETASQIVTLPPEYSLEKLGSAGKPLFPVQIMIMEGEAILSPHKAGEIIVKGPNVTSGYLHREDANRESFKDGWFHTGDIGYLDEEGFLFVLDRRSDLIISGGENVYPAEIEATLLSHPQVEEAGVIGVKDEKWGEVPVAFLVAKQRAEKEELSHFCRERLAKFKTPKEFIYVEELPRNASKKLLRRELRAIFLKGERNEH